MNGGEKLRLVSVCDKETGVCLFQRAWQWRGDQERSSIGNLVQSFYQFAREVDQGGTKNACGKRKPVYRTRIQIAIYL